MYVPEKRAQELQYVESAPKMGVVFIRDMDA